MLPLEATQPKALPRQNGIRSMPCDAAPHQLCRIFTGCIRKKPIPTPAAAGQSLLWLCDELWIIGDEITEEMRRDIQFCKHLNIHTRKVTEKEIAKLIGGNAK